MPKVTIDGHTIEVPDGTTILQAARLIGGAIVPPAMCYHSKLKTSGGYCRTCIVKVSKGSEKDPRPMPKPVPSCRTTVMDGMEVQNITSPEIIEARAGVVEFLLLNHPLDCPICDQAGECHLQDLGFQNGKQATRYEFARRQFAQIDIGNYIKLHMKRCIHCFRCVKLADQLTPERYHGMLFRGDHSEISTYIEKSIDNEFSGNMVDVCPVGALTDKTFRFKSRVWFTNAMDAHRDCGTTSKNGDVCTGRVRLWLKGEEVLRVTARKDVYGEVHEFICNTCRFEKKDKKDWTIEGPSAIDRHSVMSMNHYETLKTMKLDLAKIKKQLACKKIVLGEGALNPNNQ